MVGVRCVSWGEEEHSHPPHNTLCASHNFINIKQSQPAHFHQLACGRVTAPLRVHWSAIMLLLLLLLLYFRYFCIIDVIVVVFIVYACIAVTFVCCCCCCCLLLLLLLQLAVTTVEILRWKDTLLWFVGLEADLQHPIAQCITVQCTNCHCRFIIIGHRYEAVAFALICGLVLNNFNRLHSAEWAE